MFMASAANAQAFMPCRPGATVRYVNGVGAPNKLAVSDAADELATNIARFSVSCVANVSYLFNPSDGKFTDVIRESALQKASELRIALADAILNVGYVMFGLPTPLFTSTQQNELRDRIVAVMQEVSLSSYSFTVDGKTFTTGSLVNEFRDRVVIDLSQGTKVVLVGHSQGNFFANETRRAVNGVVALGLQRGLAVVNVANATLSAPSGLTITSRQDVFMGILTSLGLALPAFDDAGITSRDYWGHGFVEVYLRTDLPSGTAQANSMAGRVMGLLQRALTDTPDPEGSIIGSTSTSLFRISLTTKTAQILGTFRSASLDLTPVFDIAINPRGGTAMAISPSAVSTFDPGIRTLTRLSASNRGGNALTFNAEGELFSMSEDSVYRVDSVTGIATPLAVTLGTYRSSGDLTFDSDGVLWGTARGTTGRDTLIKIDTLRSMLTFVGTDTGFANVWGLYFSGGILFGATTNGQLITIDRSTGRGTLSANLGIGDITGLQ